MTRQILIVEDDVAIREGVRDALEGSGFACLEAEDATTAIELIHSTIPDLVLLDVVLPDFDGFAVLQRVRESHPSLPVIMLTARGEEQLRVKGLRQGADDYVVKPFSVSELLARIDAVLRRYPQNDMMRDRIDLGNNGQVDFVRKMVSWSSGQTADLSEREADLLWYLYSQRGRPVGRDELIERVWKLNPQGVHTRTIDVHVGRLREKIGDGGETPERIVTIRGRGYMFVAAEGDG
ncbi:MAG TPA: response regulator transcription factor [Planctomycetes bacterium]|jgi:DNA-binding response OmpR family regulator|nr:response regulator transcription factor [Planctomycetaceae bacterium]HIM28464.1 response regulator transcription factor [Planctomycetota bacterium]